MTESGEQLVEPTGVHKFDKNVFYNYLQRVLPPNVINNVTVEGVRVKQFK